MLMYNYEIQIDKSNPVAQIYFRDLDRSYHYNRNVYGGKYDIDPLLAQKLLRNLIATMISLGQVVNLPGSSESLKWDVRLCPLDWDMELRLKLSNWFLTNGYKSFEDISKDYKFRTGIPLAVKVLQELFVNADDEVDLQLVLEIINAFKIPFKVKSIEMELG